MTTVKVVQGNILQVPADAMIVAINSTGLWYGQIDTALMESVGSFYHGELQKRMPLLDGDVVLTETPSDFNHEFGRIIFVVDDLKRPLSAIAGFGLTEADRHHLAKVTLPTIRMGNMAGVYPREDPMAEIARAVRNFTRRGPKHVREVEVVVYNDYLTYNRLSQLI